METVSVTERENRQLLKDLYETIQSGSCVGTCLHAHEPGVCRKCRSTADVVLARPCWEYRRNVLRDK